MRKPFNVRVSTLVVSALTLVTAETLLSTPASAAPPDTALDAQVDAATADVFARAAEQSLESRAMAIVGTSTTKRSLGPLVGGKVAVDAGLIAREGSMADAIHAHRAWLRSVGEGYTGADTTLTMETVKRTGSVVTVDANEVTMLTYEKITGTEPPTTGYTARHTFVFRQDAAGAWQLMEDRQLEPTGLLPLRKAETFVYKGAKAAPSPSTAPPAPKVDLTPAATSKPTTLTAPAPKGSGAVTALASYNYQAMANYLETYWSNYNTNYRTFSERGGDCTNFASQALRAGGWADDTGYYQSAENWWYNYLNQTYSWVNVDYWARFASYYSGRVYLLGNVWNMGLGDVLQIDGEPDGVKDHTMMVSYVSGGTPYFTYHTNNRYRRSMNQVLSDWGASDYYAWRT